MDTETTKAYSDVVAELNDKFRKKMVGCTITRGIADLAPFIEDIFFAVRAYKDFSEDNDPYGEHDFGSFVLFDIRVFWKIDYYDPELKGWCDPTDPMCRRQLTIMRAEEY